MKHVEISLMEDDELSIDEQLLNKFAWYINALIEGDTYFLEELTEDLQKLGYWDEDGFPTDKVYEWKEQ